MLGTTHSSHPGTRAAAKPRHRCDSFPFLPTLSPVMTLRTTQVAAAAIRRRGRGGREEDRWRWGGMCWMGRIPRNTRKAVGS